MDNIEYSEIANMYICHYCKYSTTLLASVKQHINTKKHNRNLIPPSNICEYCHKSYSSRMSLLNHQRRTCKGKIAEKKLQELKLEKMEEEIEGIKDGTIPITNKDGIPITTAVNTTINNNTQNITNDNKVIVNQHFNLQFYLNDTCKDAINISEFTKSIEMTMEDLLYIGNNGWAEGMSRIITNNLKKLEAEKRPIQTSDAKRAVTYIKDGDWVKDGEDKDLISDAIETLNKEQYSLVGQWTKQNPPAPGTKAADDFHKVIMNLNPGDNKGKKVNKVKRSIRNATAIDKTNEGD